MHGGMGMTDQFDIGFFMKRARVCQELFGDSNYHADQLGADEELLRLRHSGAREARTTHVIIRRRVIQHTAASQIMRRL